MQTYIGIDLGTTAVKLLLVDSAGEILSEASETYAVSYPQPGWSEQEPEDWLQATLSGLQKLLCGQDRQAVRGLSFAGQMHGLVALDAADAVIRPCILWNDGRTEAETRYLNEQIGLETLLEQSGNIAFAGFTAPKLLWLKEHEPEHFARIAKIMLPKDFLAYRLSGAFCTDLSDASGTLLLDVANRCWSATMCRICGISATQLPALYESFAPVGTLTPAIAKQLGLSEEVIVAAGAGDNAAAAIGTGTVRQDSCNISLGTSGTIFLPCERFSAAEGGALHAFCHANGKWHLMGCILSAAACNQWWLEKILGTQAYAQEEQAASATTVTDTPFFLPYLMGERSPHNDVHAQAAFIGLSAATTRAAMNRAVLEGVAFALRDCLERAKESGAAPKHATLCGGGAKNKLWQQILADILGLPVVLPATEQGPAFGAAILAMVACGAYPSVEVAAEAILCYGETCMPDPQQQALYQQKYEKFKQLYPLLKDFYQ